MVFPAIRRKKEQAIARGGGAGEESIAPAGFQEAPLGDFMNKIAAIKQGNDLRPAWVTKALQANGALKAGKSP